MISNLINLLVLFIEINLVQSENYPIILGLPNDCIHIKDTNRDCSSWKGHVLSWLIIEKHSFQGSSRPVYLSSEISCRTICLKDANCNTVAFKSPSTCQVGKSTGFQENKEFSTSVFACCPMEKAKADDENHLVLSSDQFSQCLPIQRNFKNCWNKKWIKYSTTDSNHFDLEKIHKLSLEQCQTICFSRPSCAAIIYKKDPRLSVCTLKYKISAMVNSPGNDAYVYSCCIGSYQILPGFQDGCIKHPHSNRDCSTTTMLTWVLMKQYSLKGLYIKIPDTNEINCRKICYQNVSCNAATFEHPSTCFIANANGYQWVKDFYTSALTCCPVIKAKAENQVILSSNQKLSEKCVAIERNHVKCLTRMWIKYEDHDSFHFDIEEYFKISEKQCMSKCLSNVACSIFTYKTDSEKSVCTLKYGMSYRVIRLGYDVYVYSCCSGDHIPVVVGNSNDCISTTNRGKSSCKNYPDKMLVWMILKEKAFQGENDRTDLIDEIQCRQKCLDDPGCNAINIGRPSDCWFGQSLTFIKEEHGIKFASALACCTPKHSNQEVYDIVQSSADTASCYPIQHDDKQCSSKKWIEYEKQEGFLMELERFTDISKEICQNLCFSNSWCSLFNYKSAQSLCTLNYGLYKMIKPSDTNNVMVLSCCDVSSMQESHKIVAFNKTTEKCFPIHRNNSKCQNKIWLKYSQRYTNFMVLHEYVNIPLEQCQQLCFVNPHCSVFTYVRDIEGFDCSLKYGVYNIIQGRHSVYVYACCDSA